MAWQRQAGSSGGSRRLQIIACCTRRHTGQEEHCHLTREGEEGGGRGRGEKRRISSLSCTLPRVHWAIVHIVITGNIAVIEEEREVEREDWAKT